MRCVGITFSLAFSLAFGGRTRSGCTSVGFRAGKSNARKAWLARLTWNTFFGVVSNCIDVS